MNRFTSAQTFPRIKAITFHADGTLWDFKLAMESALESTLQQLRRIVPNVATEQLTIRKMIDIREHVARELGEGVVTHEEIRYAAFLRTLEYVGAPSQAVAEQLYRFYMDARFAYTRPYPDMKSALGGLKSLYRIGMISKRVCEKFKLGWC